MKGKGKKPKRMGKKTGLFNEKELFGKRNKQNVGRKVLTSVILQVAR